MSNIKVVSIANLAESSSQEVFDFVADSLLRQGRKSMIGTKCAYRGEGGAKCAAGFLLPDECEVVKEPSYNSLIWVELAFKELVPRVHTHLVRDMQRIHDGFDVEAWPDELIDLAVRNNLEYKVVSAFINATQEV